MFQSNLPLYRVEGRAVIWDKLGSLCRAECTAFLKSWVNIKHKRKYLSESSELPLSLCLCLQMSSNEVIRESGSVQPPLLHVTMVLSNHLPPFIRRGWVLLVCPPRAHTGGGGRQKSHKVCPHLPIHTVLTGPCPSHKSQQAIRKALVKCENPTGQPGR